MNLRTSIVLCLVSVAWVATCVFALTTYEHRPCLTYPPGTGTGNCAQTSCHEYLDSYARSVGMEYTKCGDSEYFMNCEEKEPDPAVCATWYRYNTPEDCENDELCYYSYDTNTGEPSCKKYPWQP